MKRQLRHLILIMSVLVGLCGCGNKTTVLHSNKENDTPVQQNEQSADNEEKTTQELNEEKESSVEEDLAAQIKVVEYSYINEYSNYHFVEVTNETNKVVDVYLNILYYNSDDELVNASTPGQDVIEPGYSVLLVSTPDEKWSRTEINVEASETKYYDPIQSDIKVDVTPAKEKIVVQAENVGKNAADFVAISALAFLGDEVVGYDFNYFTDNENQIKPGKSIAKNLEFYKDFDNYKYYVTGRRTQ